MKRILYIILTISLFVGCEDNLIQENPTGPTGDDFFQTERDVQLAVVAAYGGLTNENAPWGNNMWGVEAMSDNAYGIADAPYNRLDEFEHDSNTGLIQNYYGYLYRAINRSNLVLQKAPQIEGIAQADLDNYLGQVYFLRGYEYFLLTLLFEDVPIILEPPVEPAGYSVAASPAADVYAQAIADLEMAEQLLPDTQDDAGRVISMTATAMLAKVYLFGADELGNTAWYGEAEQKAAQVINSGTYQLVDDPALTPHENLVSLWSLDNQNSTEDIFAVQHYSSGGWSNGNVASSYPMGINPRLDRALNIWGFGWMHTYESVEAQWDDADPRKRFTLFFDGDDVVTINGDTLGQYSSSTARGESRRDSGGPKKFWWSESFDRVSGQSDLDAKVLRYADLLLIHAEADLMADGTVSAAGETSFNEVRARAGLAPIAAASITRDVILEERRWELFLECHRWFDLMRTQSAEQAFDDIEALDNTLPQYFGYALNKNDFEKQGFIPQKHYKLPYPQAALDQNPALVQKPEWAASE
ncbi:MAG: RagB/SusD family nutrient uptake outer membrane protein [Cyclobacteriaceae bacterium]|nr:RagB/SusD family nutrient uptake outer membrane protein [Cyclobacteriaceae bacterium SS2]